MSSESATQIFHRLFEALASEDREATLDALRSGYELVNRAGVSAWLECMDPEIEWSEGVEVPERHVYRGHEGVLRQQERFEEAWESFRIEPVDFAASGDKLVVIVNLWGRGRGSGVEVEGRGAHLWEFRNGKAVRFEIHGDPERALREVRAQG
jgi:uncharacterized protein